MARQVRIESLGAVYHVMARGDRREDIFGDEEDREMFYTVIREAYGKFGIVLHGYVLMRNHYHLLLETPGGNLVAAMKWVQNTYTRRFNVRHRLWGHLFGGRYKAIIVDDRHPEYFVRLLDYIHLNPARIGWKQGKLNWVRYPHSSLRNYLSGGKKPEWLETGKVWRYLDLNENASGRRRFLERLERRVREEGDKKAGTGLREGQSLQSTVQRGWQFGTEDFKDRMLALKEDVLRKMRAKGANGYRGVQMRDYGEKRAEEIISAAEKILRLEAKDWEKLAKGDWRKCLVGAMIQERTGVSLDWLCGRLKMGERSYACRGLKRGRNPKNGEMAKAQRLLRMSISND